MLRLFEFYLAGLGCTIKASFALQRLPRYMDSGCCVCHGVVKGIYSARGDRVREYRRRVWRKGDWRRARPTRCMQCVDCGARIGLEEISDTGAATQTSRSAQTNIALLSANQLSPRSPCNLNYHYCICIKAS